ncbi:FAD-dependent oxidoreductase [Streptomyces sp. NPDC058686]|uniref:FAD-dependent oxidoreductase n=1 Tax=Streptomyces sp. NPDC058686 TaxID=3346599 RepID=UPI0036541373
MRMLVAGAGVSGLALALALQKRGIAAEVVDKFPEFRTPGTAVHLPGNAVRVLKLLGLQTELQKISHPVQRKMIFDHKGQESATGSATSPRPDQEVRSRLHAGRRSKNATASSRQ